VTIGARNADPAGFERLTQCLERVAVELRNYVADAPSVENLTGIPEAKETLLQSRLKKRCFTRFRQQIV
jgi:hypothetical protein